ncbi:MAG: LPXTG cell wall anchor domain-containing protein [Acidobacteriaceae bacterium]
MDTSMIVRVVAAIAFVVVLGVLILRRKRKSA